MQRAIFIDRDGTIGGSDQVEYPGEFKLFPHVRDSIDKLKKSGWFIFSFTNQPGISKGKAAKEDYELELKEFGFDKVYLCAHQQNEGCKCRKPSTGMLVQAAMENDLDLQECVVIGDRWTDMIAAHEAGCRKVLVRTGAGEEAFTNYKNSAYYGIWGAVSPDYVAPEFQEAANWILATI